ncbi:unnamed protein product (macronuclear) [Paramecium tetraurelia]|uniref:BZIP domain-containing protein n=1 Tax=Paramecium tetraurelia TaxID=5888 RepID=A0C386_PARTE|nr:uncharacterized protein GSPATT00034731001 [Paramecium tetraurelia]CAK65253.1 unnamed protein product [Paramecium tetraurelia]|eukprot:XP_001432650.1 hypothetical protein (macronuclear) [Paramecium tetraurelia strain d4-2]
MSDPIISEQYYFNESYDVNANQIDFSGIPDSFLNNQPQKRQQFPKIQIFDEADSGINNLEPNQIQFEEIKMDRLRIKNDSSIDAQPRSGSDGDNSIDASLNNRRRRRSKKYSKEEQKHLKDSLQSQIILNLGQTKSTYTNKIQNLVKNENNGRLLITTKARQSRSQQKLERKNEQQLQMNLEHSDQSSSENPDSLNDGNMDPSRLKQVKNRESARNSRARKKIYFELLETRVQELQDENDKLREQCTTLSKSIENFNKQQDKFSQFLEQQEKLFERLEDCIKQGKDATEIEILLDALKYRTSSNKQERIDAAKSYSYSILDVCLPLQTKYLFSILDDKDFFSKDSRNYTDYLRDVFKKIDTKTDDFGNNEKIKQKLGSAKQNMHDSFKKIKKEIKLIQSEAGKVDLLWEQLKEKLQPQILAQCLITLHKVQSALSMQNEFRAEFQASTLFKRQKDKKEQVGMSIEQQLLQRKQVKKCN